MKKTKFPPFSRYQVMLQQAVNNRLGTILIDLDDVEQSLGVELDAHFFPPKKEM